MFNINTRKLNHNDNVSNNANKNISVYYLLISYKIIRSFLYHKIKINYLQNDLIKMWYDWYIIKSKYIGY